MLAALTMSDCVVPGYDAATGEANRKVVERILRLRCKVIFCDDCDAYHVVYSDRYTMIDEMHRTVLEKIAMGLRDKEIAADLNVTTKQIEHAVNRLCRRFNAFSRANLVAIAIGLAIINPTAFIAKTTEREH
jgi:DNA-binding CsgD family transcriptional regulator